jgi:hypothetical protein
MRKVVRDKPDDTYALSKQSEKFNKNRPSNLEAGNSKQGAEQGRGNGTPRSNNPDPGHLNHLRSMFFAMKKTLAGRSASRRMKYGYHSCPNGT